MLKILEKFDMKLIYIALSAALISSCGLFKGSDKKPAQDIYVNNDSLAGIDTENPGFYPEEGESQPKAVYQPSKDKTFIIKHMDLELSFSYALKEVYGKQKLKMSPYFYPSNYVVLDAKGMEILSVMADGKELQHLYTNNELYVLFGRKLNRNEEISLEINYIARPDEIKNEAGAAISDSKGWYFINPDKSDPNKPRQIWTQGETEYNSCWFPIIDAPNQKLTHDIKITLYKNEVSLSNGLLVSSKVINDSMKVDHWKMDQPHAPYLVMMAIGDFSVIKDKWNNIDVHYYVEKEYEKHARLIFGNTPEMIGFYSKILGVNYPWKKYHQIVVRDFVSGAMENTTAVVHYEPVQHTDREHLDDPQELIIAHELFHHWFGDLVTCESWANLPLNESFATYGEYLWLEHKYGKWEADQHLHNNFNQYLDEASEKQVELIRYEYVKPLDMFDRHSYQKGGHVLHMLRDYLGDEAFFEGLKYYLNTHAYQSVEIHDLRLAMEKVSGLDLKWFFDQWFLGAGHPILNINHSLSTFEDGVYNYQIFVEQMVSTPRNGVFKLPVKIAVEYENGNSEILEMQIDSELDTLQFSSEVKPVSVIFDPSRILLAEIIEDKEPEIWVKEIKKDIGFIYSKKAMVPVFNSGNLELINEVLDYNLNHPYHGIRLEAMRVLARLKMADRMKYKNKLVEMAQKDQKSINRSTAIEMLNEFEDKELINLYMNACSDSSYQVISSALMALNTINPEAAVKKADSLVKENNLSIIDAVINIYAVNDKDLRHYNYFAEKLAKGSYFTQFYVLQGLGALIPNLDKEEDLLKAMDLFEIPKIKEGDVYLNMSINYLLYAIEEKLKIRKKMLSKMDNEAVKNKMQLIEQIENRIIEIGAKTGK